jgi:hypothetical protein
MKTSFFLVAPLCFCLLLRLSAQNLPEIVSVCGTDEVLRREAMTPENLPVSQRAQSAPGDRAIAIPAQDVASLEPRLRRTRAVESVLDLAVLHSPSPFRHVVSGGASGPADLPVDEVKKDLALISATYRKSGTPETDCQGLALSVSLRVRLDESSLLEVVENEVAANPACACEVVKSAIKVSDADVETVVSIVDTAITAAPETIRMVSQCAIATVPDALAGIQELLARYDANRGEGGYSSKSAKSAKGSSKSAKAIDSRVPDQVAAMPNPLDFPNGGPSGPTPGGPGGTPLLPPFPPVVITTPVTVVDP